ncbi:MAG: ribose-5-phosphate isomerase RpiA [Chlamydiales bacterium]
MKLNPQAQNEIKQAIGQKAAALVEEGMLVGLGSGTTASYFIKSLIERCRNGLKIQAVSSSIQSLEIARAGNIPIMDMAQVTSIDLTIDGADEIDPKNRMIKGGGGAHVREKIIASSSKKMIIIVDESKLVDELGQFGLPVEILPFGYQATIAKMKKLNYEGELRKKEDGSSYISDNGNYIFDIHEPKRFPHPEQDHDRIVNLAGVVETGFFFNLPVQVLVGYADGTVAFRTTKERQ